MKRFYQWSRDLHLYAGLFISPFILLFAASVVFLNHGRLPPDLPSTVRTFQDVLVPRGLESASGREAVNLAREILPQLGINGEIGFLRPVRADRHLLFPVSKPGAEMMVDIDLAARAASLSTRRTGTWEALAYLHKSPGPHLVAIRGNWIWTRLWRWFADATTYLTLFISLSGIYLWYAIRAERAIGAALLAAGALSFFGLIYAVIR